MAQFPKESVARALLAKNIRSLRSLAGYSQETLSELAGFHRTYISQVERGTTNISIDNVERLAAVFGVPIGKLFDNEE